MLHGACTCVHMSAIPECMTRSITIRIEDHLYDALQAAAEEEDRSMNNLIARHLTEATRLREGHSTLGSTPSVSKRQMKRTPLDHAEAIHEAEADVEDVMELARQAAKHGMTLEQYRDHLRPRVKDAESTVPTHGAYRGPGDDPAWQA